MKYSAVSVESKGSGVMTTYLVTSGEYSDYRVDAIIQSSRELTAADCTTILNAAYDVPELSYERRRTMTPEGLAAYAARIAADRRAAENAKAAEYDAVVLDYVEIDR